MSGRLGTARRLGLAGAFAAAVALAGGGPVSAAGPAPDWQVPLDAPMYARPVVAGDRVIAATEGDTVYAVDPADGRILWQRSVGTPVPQSALPCGDIDPVGITGTPAVDQARGLVYVAALVQPTHHELVALDLASGEIRYRYAIDAPGSDPAAQGQRGALTVANGKVYVPFGGRYGDCGRYRGVVVAVESGDASGSSLVAYQTPATEAGIWAPGGASVDADGNLYVATGNGGSASFGYSESVIKLSPDLQVLDSFTPASWQQLDSGDTDIGSISPVVMDNGLVFQSGKNGVGYLLRQSGLGQIGGEAFSGRACDSAAFGAAAYASGTLYVPCSDRIVALQVNAQDPSFQVAWRGPAESGRPAAGSPVLAGGLVWTVDVGGRALLGLDAGSGTTSFTARLPGAEHFTTPAIDGRRVVVPAGSSLVAFSPPQLASSTAAPVAGAACPPGQQPSFHFGFAALRAQIGDVMGAPTSCEYADPAGTGDTEQLTSTGLAYWRKATNTPTFTDGVRHWALTAEGLITWTGPGVDPPPGSS